MHLYQVRGMAHIFKIVFCRVQVCWVGCGISGGTYRALEVPGVEALGNLQDVSGAVWRSHREP